ncbi:hypothetical protein ACO0SA_004233 [Hanseniaspora valbyensis]
MSEQKILNFPLPDGAEDLSLHELQALVKNEEYLTHYVINKSYNQLKEITTIDNEIETLRTLKQQYDDLIYSKLQEDIDLVENKIEELSTGLLDLVDYKKMLRDDFKPETIKKKLDSYLVKVKKIEIDPLVKQISEDPFDTKLHDQYIEKLSKWEKMKILFDSLV